MTTSSPQVLIVEDEAPIRRFLRAALTDEGYRYNEAQTGKEGLKLASTARPDIVLLDLGLPDLDGLEVIRQLREWSKVPIIVLSARGQEADKVRALDAGANDYLTKPFGVGELLARLRVALRVAARDAAPQDVPVFETADFRVDLVARRVVVRGSEVHLTPIEYRLLTTLIRHAGKVLTHRYLL
jgi:two-component system KDP operon response regulator KdpE